jgi:hypothetical protein
MKLWEGIVMRHFLDWPVGKDRLCGIRKRRVQKGEHAVNDVVLGKCSRFPSCPCIHEIPMRT